MMLAGLKVRIKDFWPCLISKKFPNLEFRIIDIQPVGETDARGILEVRNTKNIKKVVEFLLKSETTQVETLTKDRYSNLISVYFSHGPLVKVLVSSGVFVRPPIHLREGEIWVNVIGRDENLRKFLTESGREQNVEVELRKKRELKYFKKPKLTSKQEHLLKRAVDLGFYDVPRRITLKKLSEKLGLSQSNISEHLRKAEEKLIKDYF
ncbi:MAG: helix-turn-helix domain-containing protein [Candidatus Methanofastidiosia archaeon]